MADSYTTLTKTTTATTGTNNYVLATANLASAHRTPKQAVADGSLSDGDIVHYCCRDTTVTGDASFEEGTGVYTDATNTVARLAANVLDGSGGPGVLVSWPGSGQRDFYILGTVAQKAARTDRANTFTENQTVSKAATPTFEVVSSGTPSAPTQLADISQSVATLKKTNNSGTALIRVEPIPSDNTSAAYIDPFRNTNTVGARRMRFYEGDGSATITAYMDTATGQLYKGSTPYDAFPSGTKMLFATAPPTGWTRVNEASNGWLIRLADSGDTVGATGGTDDIFDGNWDTAGHTLSVAEIPAHTHDVPTSTLGTDDGSNVRAKTAGGGTIATSSVGGGGSHDHNMATPRYRIACWATKD